MTEVFIINVNGTVQNILHSNIKDQDRTSVRGMADFNYSLFVALPLVTVFWLIVAISGFVVPCFIPQNKNRGVIGTMIVLTAVCCYVFWLIAFLAQLNPLFGPDVENGAAAHMRKAWNGYGLLENSNFSCYPSW